MKKSLLIVTSALLLTAGIVSAEEVTVDERVVVDVVGEDGQSIKVIELGGDHPMEGHRMRFISEDGEVHEIDDATRNHWVSKIGGGDLVFHAPPGPHAVLGVQLVELTPELRAHYGVATDAGVMVSRVIEDSAAARAGIEVGDILTAVDGESVASTQGVRHNLMGKEDGDVIVVDLFRNGRQMTLTADAEVREGPQMMQHRIEVHCDSDEGCDSPHATAFQNECDGAEQCEVMVNCSDDGCSCTVNDEAVDCPDSMPHHRE